MFYYKFKNHGIETEWKVAKTAAEFKENIFNSTWHKRRRENGHITEYVTFDESSTVASFWHSNRWLNMRTGKTFDYAKQKLKVK